MTQPPDIHYLNPHQVASDVEHVKILSICWYVLSCLALVFGSVPIFHVVFGLMMVFKPSIFTGGPPPPAFMGWFMIAVGTFFILFCWACGILGLVTAYSLPRRRRLTLCYVAAALACLQMPMGTVLGVFTFIVLSRPTVKATFT
jgi:hypothetical protein